MELEMKLEEQVEFELADGMKINEWGFIQFLAKHNDPNFNVYKLCEELTELQEVLLKSQLKHPDHKPKLSSIVEEAGDVIVRLAILMEQLGIEKQVGDRSTYKVSKLYEYFKEGKYKNGI